MPAGIYTASFDSDPVGGVGFHLQLAITVTVDSIVVDFAGSSPQVPFGINACLAYARAYAIYGLKCLLAPELPLNEGAVRPILVVAPEGSIVNSRFPAAGTARHLVGMHIPALIFEALADAMPTAVTGECGAPPPILSISGVEVEGGALFGAWLEVHSGFGGRASADGGSVLGFPANTQMASIEMTEATSPLLFKCRELLPDSAGEGRFRGGLGQRVAVESLAHRAYAAILLEPNAPRGVHGGRSGTGARALLGDVEIDDYSVPIELKPGEVLTIESAGGGGYGDPITRPADAMRRDTEDGYISEEEA
jgi:N-methylhydantoinase B